MRFGFFFCTVLFSRKIATINDLKKNFFLFVQLEFLRTYQIIRQNKLQLDTGTIEEAFS